MGLRGIEGERGLRSILKLEIFHEFGDPEWDCRFLILRNTFRRKPNCLHESFIKDFNIKKKKSYSENKKQVFKANTFNLKGGKVLNLGPFEKEPFSSLV